MVLFLVTSAGMMCGPSVPEPDVCEQPSNASVTALELGEGSLSAVFVPWQQGQAVPVVVGGQGSPMFAMRVRIQGQSAQCVAVATRVVSAQDEILTDELLLLSAYPQDDGSFITDTHWVVLQGLFTASDESVTVDVAVAGSTTTHTIVLDQ